jgi:carboxymethylenebutenolidase
MARVEDQRVNLAGEDRAVAVARPDGEGPWPGVLVVHEAWGLNDDIRNLAARFADHGYLAAAPDLLGGGLRCMIRAFRDLTRGAGGHVDQARAALAWLAAHPDVKEHRVGVTGFCMGGGFALLLGVEETSRAIAPNYGVVPRDPDHLRRLCPTIGSYGGRDRALRGDGERLAAALREHGIPGEVTFYPGAGHSFMNRGAPGLMGPLMRVAGAGYREEAAEDAWRRILAFFGEHVAGEPAAA